MPKGSLDVCFPNGTHPVPLWCDPSKTKCCDCQDKTGVGVVEHRILQLNYLNWLLINFKKKLKVLVANFKTLHGLGLRYLKRWLLHPSRLKCMPLRSSATPWIGLWRNGPLIFMAVHGFELGSSWSQSWHSNHDITWMHVRCMCSACMCRGERQPFGSLVLVFTPVEFEKQDSEILGK